MERGVVVGGLMICGSFLLAALLNRSAMEEMPAPAAPPAVIAPISPPAAESQLPPDTMDCTEPEADADPAVTKTEQASIDRCGHPE